MKKSNNYLPGIYLLLMLLSTIGCGEHPQIEPVTEDTVILAFGNSLTWGTGTTSDNSYPVLLGEMLDCEVINSGVPGELSQEGLARLPDLLDEHEPDLVILCHGGNDILRRKNMDKLSANINSMIELIKESGADIVIVGVPEFGISLKPAKLYSKIAREYRLPYEGKALQEIVSSKSLKSDHVHPNAKGYKKMAKSITAVIREYEKRE